MAYTPFHDPWGYGDDCCNGPAAGQPDTKITHLACDHWEEGIFNAAATADLALAGLDDKVDVVTGLGAFVLGQTGWSSAAVSYSAPGISSRSLANIPVNTTRWRMHVRNFNAAGDSAPGSGTFNINGIWFGSHPLGTPASLAQAVTAFVLTNQVEFVSSWVTSAPLQFKANEIAMLSFGITSSSVGAVINTGAGGSLITLDAADASNPAPGGITNLDTQLLDWWIEYETVDPFNRRSLVIGDSIPQGYGMSGAQQYHSYKAWPAQYGTRRKNLVCNAAIASRQFTNFTGSQPIFTRFGTGAGFIWDEVIISLGSNDLGAGADLNTLVTRLLVTVGAVRTAFNPRRIFVMPVLPKSSVGAPETQRNLYNAWLMENTEQYVGASSLMTHEVMDNPASPGTLRTADSPDTVHLNVSGHTRLANSLI